MILRNLIFLAAIVNFAIFIGQYEAREEASYVAAALLVVGLVLLLAGRRKTSGGAQRLGLSLIALGGLVLVAVILVALYRTWEWVW